jgi:hypothetical protein
MENVHQELVFNQKVLKGAIMDMAMLKFQVELLSEVFIKTQSNESWHELIRTQVALAELRNRFRKVSYVLN